jgi:tRNA (guanine-N7-)-methyltransferase
MPLRRYNPFEDINPKVNLDVNPYIKEIVEASKNESLPVAYGPYLKGLKSNWKEFLKSRGKMENTPESLVLEIGCHQGLVLRKMAQDFPKAGFLGMDITFKRVIKTVKGAKNDGTNNLGAIYCNAGSLDEIFADRELDGVVIFFPDPWCKKERQLKNRLINDEFTDKLFKLVKSGGFVWFKTDHKPYFEDADKSFLNAGFTEKTDGCWLSKNVYESTFESKFKLEGIPKNEKIYVKLDS